MKGLFLVFALLFQMNIFADSSVDFTAAVDIDDLPAQQLSPMVKMVFDADTADLDAGDLLNYEAYIPEGAIVTDIFYKVINKVVSANDNSLSLGCNASTNDLVNAATLSSSHASGDVEIVKAFGSSGDLIEIGSGGCTIRGVVGAGASGITEGKVAFYFKYVNSEVSAGD